jgi:hypothetical protein
MKKFLVLALAVATMTATAQVDPNGVTIDGNNCGNVSVKNSGSGINGSYFDDVYDSNIGSFNGNSTLTGDITNKNRNVNTNTNRNVNNNSNTNRNRNLNTNTSTSRGGNSRNNVNVDASQEALQLDVLSQRMVGGASLLFSVGNTYASVGQGTLAFAQASAVRNEVYREYKLGRVETLLNGQSQQQISRKQWNKVQRIISKGGKTEKLESGYKVAYFKGKYRYDLTIDVNPARIDVGQGYEPAFWLTKTLIH